MQKYFQDEYLKLHKDEPEVKEEFAQKNVEDTLCEQQLTLEKISQKEEAFMKCNCVGENCCYRLVYKYKKFCHEKQEYWYENYGSLQNPNIMSNFVSKASLLEFHYFPSLNSPNQETGTLFAYNKH